MISAFTCRQKQGEGKANTLRSYYPSSQPLCAFYHMPTDASTVLNQMTLVFTLFPHVFSLEGSLLRMRILESDCLGLDPSSTTSWLLDLQQLAYNAQCLSSIICKMGMTTISILHGNYEGRIRWFMPIEMQT